MLRKRATTPLPVHSAKAKIGALSSNVSRNAFLPRGRALAFAFLGMFGLATLGYALFARTQAVPPQKALVYTQVSMEAWTHPSHQDIKSIKPVVVASFTGGKENNCGIELGIASARATCKLTHGPLCNTHVHVDGEQVIAEREWAFIYCHADLAAGTLEVAVLGESWRYGMRLMPRGEAGK